MGVDIAIRHTLSGALAHFAKTGIAQLPDALGLGAWARWKALFNTGVVQWHFSRTYHQNPSLETDRSSSVEVDDYKIY